MHYIMAYEGYLSIKKLNLQLFHISPKIGITSFITIKMECQHFNYFCLMFHQSRCCTAQKVEKKIVHGTNSGTPFTDDLQTCSLLLTFTYCSKTKPNQDTKSLTFLEVVHLQKGHVCAWYKDHPTLQSHDSNMHDIIGVQPSFMILDQVQSDTIFNVCLCVLESCRVAHGTVYGTDCHTPSCHWCNGEAPVQYSKHLGSKTTGIVVIFVLGFLHIDCHTLTSVDR